jgi:sugar phosphate isomerase/epimerase
MRLGIFADEISPMLDEQIKAMQRENIRYLELRGVDNKAVLTLTVEEAKQIKERIDACGIGVTAIGSPIGKIGIEEDFALHLEGFKYALELAHIFGTKYIRLFSYFIPEDANPAKYRGQVMERMARKVELAGEAGIVLLHENEKDIYGETSRRCRDILTTIDSPYLRAIFDPANFVQAGEKPFNNAYPKVADFIKEMHIKDALFADGSVVPAGQGDGQVRELLIALKDRGFDGFLVLEPHLKAAGRFGGFSGPELFHTAAQALKRLLEECGIPYE